MSDQELDPEKPVIVVMCAKMTNPRLTGYFGPYKCLQCEQEVQTTANGKKNIEEGGFVLCNDCGFKLLEDRKKLKRPTAVKLGGEAIRSLKDMIDKQHSDN